MSKSKVSSNTVTPKRPPVVVVLGHVDHGKTTLLDTIRKANVVAGEAGGITQHIGAYQVLTKADDPTSLITFIDTPGHEAFSKMRSRGASVADIAILVVAANDGVKPQTKEAISHIKQADLPFIVAINKIDIEGIVLDTVKAQLAEQEVFVEGYGGDVVAVPISARQNKGIDQLLEMIHLLYELQEVKETSLDLEAIVLESFIDTHKGVITNVLVKSGSLVQGQMVYADDGQQTKVRSLLADTGKHVTEARASQPVQIMGFASVVPVGAVIAAVPITLESRLKEKHQAVVVEGEEEKPRLKLIIKADVAGTLEAIKANLTDEIELVGDGVGDLSESDVLLARSTGARLIGFHVQVPTSVRKLAAMEEVKIETFDVIYHLLEDLQARVLKLMEPTINEEIMGKAEVIAEFKMHGTHIAGCKVVEGSIVRANRVRVMREERMTSEPRIGAMQVERKEVTEAKKGQEVALVFRPDVKFMVGDQIISYKIVD